MENLITFRISGVNFLYGNDGDLEEIDLNFDTRDPLNAIFTNGRVSITPDEYFMANGLTELAGKVKNMYVARILGDEEAVEEEAEAAE
ncbi:hypothetical protein [Alkalicoccobacillus gibsonii]|uniref:hypothetical protein n=1 Tax=Alkalicoccobacillus gibsonii TaxID=79881 RepID=UPI003515C5D1